MLTLSSDTLTVSLLDPSDPVDQARQGTRYCWGGYIWQVTDAQAGPLFTGAQWPEPKPKPFNGQGLPESFRAAEFGTGHPLILEDNRGFIIGAGEVAPDAEGKLTVIHPCTWAVTRSGGTLEFCTAQSGNGYACQLTRRVTLTGQTLTSATSLVNTGTRPLPLHWFAHPFFALNDRLLTCSIPNDWGMAENVGYTLDVARGPGAQGNVIHFKRRFQHIDDGHFEQLIVGKSVLRAELSHPKLSGIIFTTDFVPDTCPIWGNNNTWSIEPYIATALAPGAHRAWSLHYEMGKSPPV